MVMLWNDLSKNLNGLIEIHKEKLPSKAVRDCCPTVLWFTPPQNINFNDNV